MHGEVRPIRPLIEEGAMMNDLVQYLAANTGPGGSFTISFCEHRRYYQTVSEALDDRGEDWITLVDRADRAKCVGSDVLWVLQWYPKTPIGFYVFGGSTPDKLLDLAKSVEL